jgi:hypothetical protein
MLDRDIVVLQTLGLGLCLVHQRHGAPAEVGLGAPGNARQLFDAFGKLASQRLRISSGALDQRTADPTLLLQDGGQ